MEPGFTGHGHRRNGHFNSIEMSRCAAEIGEKERRPVLIQGKAATTTRTYPRATATLPIVGIVVGPTAIAVVSPVRRILF
jgi:hypothetical protein